jgi:hypothetical protein
MLVLTRRGTHTLEELLSVLDVTGGDRHGGGFLGVRCKTATKEKNGFWERSDVVAQNKEAGWLGALCFFRCLNSPPSLPLPTPHVAPIAISIPTLVYALSLPSIGSEGWKKKYNNIILPFFFNHETFSLGRATCPA